MPKLIKDGQITEDSWLWLKEATGPEVLQAAPGRRFIVPLKFWQTYREELLDSTDAPAVWLNSDELPSELVNDLALLPLIAVNFPSFADGRGYSIARELRQDYSYTGDIRAVGDVLRDQMAYLAKVGFSSFALRYDQDPQQCLDAISDFTTHYTATVVEPQPLFRRR
jgi:uncharacterized protein (DUF934 family)